MKNNYPVENHHERLVGIKTIAAYLELSVRSIYRWEEEFGLPLHRLTGGRGSRVYAYKEELDDWLKKHDRTKLPVDTQFKIRSYALFVILGCFLLIGLGSIIFLAINKSPNPEIVSFDDKTVIMKNANNTVLWSFNYGKPVNGANLNSIVDLDDIDGDGCNEVVGCIYDYNKDKYYISLFDNNGSPVWKRAITTNQSFNHLKIDDYYCPGPVMFARDKNGEPLIISKWNHRERFIAVIACHDKEGNLVNQYLHTGNLTRTLKLHDVNGDGVGEIIFTGTNNLLNGEGIIGVLPLSGFKGISPPYRVEPEYANLSFRLSKYIPDNPIAGNQLVYLRFKRTKVLPRYSAVYKNTLLIYCGNDQLQFRLVPWMLDKENPTIGIDYVFDNNLIIQDVLATPELVRLYPEFVKAGETSIPLDEVMRDAPGNVFRWDEGKWIANPCAIQ